MNEILDILGGISFFIGIIFYIAGTIGIARLPNTYSKLHASGKVGTVGLFFVLLGVAFHMPSATSKAFLLGLFMLIAGPVASHSIAAAIFRTEEEKKRAKIEKLHTLRDTNVVPVVEVSDHM